MNADDLDTRLRTALDWDAAVARPAVTVDMSPEAIAARLIEAFDLSRLCLELGEGHRVNATFTP